MYPSQKRQKNNLRSKKCDSDYESEVDSDLEEDIVFKKLLE